MKRSIIIVIGLLLSMLTGPALQAQGSLTNGWVASSQRNALLSSLRYNPAADDSFEFEYEKSPGRAFLLSALVPGSGELYAGAKWRALAFASVEVFSWVLYFNRKNRGEDLEKQYKRFADSHWDLIDWLIYSATNDFCGPGGSHQIWVTYTKSGTAQEYLVDESFPGDSLMAMAPAEDGILDPIRTRDYYENIGKYDQFACGWDDYLDVHDVNADTVLMTPNRDRYLTQRKKSNDALKMATNFATVIMFNHLISAFHAQIAAKNYSPEPDRVSWHVGLLTDVRRKNPIRGVSLSLAF